MGLGGASLAILHGTCQYKTAQEKITASRVKEGQGYESGFCIGLSLQPPPYFDQQGVGVAWCVCVCMRAMYNMLCISPVKRGEGVSTVRVCVGLMIRASCCSSVANCNNGVGLILQHGPNT